jgi:hypothetical protein
MLTMRMTPKMRDEAAREEKEQRAVREAVERLDHPEVRPHAVPTQTQHAGGVGADDAFLIFAAEPGRFRLDDGERPLEAHVEAEVGAQHHPIRTDGGDEIAEGRRVVADDVVGEATEIGAEGFLRHTFRLRPHSLSVTQASVQIRQGAARVGQAHRELGQPIEHAPEHQMRGGDGRVERIAEEIVQIVGSEPLRADDPEGMQEHRQPKRGRALEDGKNSGSDSSRPPTLVPCTHRGCRAASPRAPARRGRAVHLARAPWRSPRSDQDARRALRSLRRSRRRTGARRWPRRPSTPWAR